MPVINNGEYPRKHRTSGSVEQRFSELNYTEYEELAEHLDGEFHWSLADYLRKFTYREMRLALDHIQR